MRLHGGAPARSIMLIAAISVVALSACGVAPPPVGQVVARVNDREITIHQLHRILQQAPESSRDRQRQAIDRLVQRELAVEQALAMKLDREPEIMLQLEEARREALAAAWADRTAAALPTADAGAAARYYAAHPGLFTERRLYRLQALILPSDDALAEGMQARLKQGAGLPDIRSWLAAGSVHYTERELVRLAEQLPIEAVDRLWQVPAGKAIAFRSPEALTLYQVQSAETMPLDWKAAEPAIRTHLAAQARIAVLEAEMRRLRERARIEYAASARS